MTQVLAKPICDIINLSKKLSTFPDKCKIAKLAPLFKKDPRLTLKIIGQSHCFPLYLNNRESNPHTSAGVPRQKLFNLQIFNKF